MPIRRKLRNALLHYRTGGARLVCEVISDYHLLPAALFHLHGWDLLRLRRMRESALRRWPGGVEFVPAGEADFPALVALTGHHGSPELITHFHRFHAAGGRCIVARREGEPLGYNWYFRNAYTLSNDGFRDRQLHLRLEPQMCLAGSGFIAPAHRLSGLFPHFYRAARELEPAGTRFYTAIARLNEGSRRAHHRLGFETFASVCCERWLGSPCRWSLTTPKGRDRIGWRAPRVSLEALERAAGSGASPRMQAAAP